MSNAETTLEEESNPTLPPNPDETAQAPADSTAAQPDDLDALVAEYDQATQDSAQASELLESGGKVASGDLDAMLDESIRNDVIAHIDPRDEQIRALQAEAHYKRESEAFDKWTDECQAKCGDTVPDNFFKAEIMSARSERPELDLAWDNRNLTDDQRRDVDLRLRKVEHAIQVVTRAPDDPRKGFVLKRLAEEGHRLGLALNGREIVRRLERSIIERGRKFQPIDEELTSDRNMVAAAVRNASSKLPEAPPPDVAHMTDKELRDYKRSLWGGIGGSR
jgi:hypothetical protein